MNSFNTIPKFRLAVIVSVSLLVLTSIGFVIFYQPSAPEEKLELVSDSGGNVATEEPLKTTPSQYTKQQLLLINRDISSPEANHLSNPRITRSEMTNDHIYTYVTLYNQIAKQDQKYGYIFRVNGDKLIPLVTSQSDISISSLTRQGVPRPIIDIVGMDDGYDY